MATKKTTSKAKTTSSLSELLQAKLMHNFSVVPEEATNEHFYNALVLVLRDKLRTARVNYIHDTHQQDAKQVYYLCMEFLMGRSLKNTLYNLGLTEEAERVLADFHVKLDSLLGMWSSP